MDMHYRLGQNLNDKTLNDFKQCLALLSDREMVYKVEEEKDLKKGIREYHYIKRDSHVVTILNIRWDKMGIGTIKQVVTARKIRRQGLATNLIAKMFDKTNFNNLRDRKLVLKCENYLIPFYESFGFISFAQKNAKNGILLTLMQKNLTYEEITKIKSRYGIGD